MSEQMLAALARERDGYAARGLEDRVAMVEEQIAVLGGTVESPEDESSDSEVESPDTEVESPGDEPDPKPAAKRRTRKS